ncbi:uncharacterized protein [Branchiostoma lanceolatum]|uniref:uncharacterized protein isoform X2 n=1 Tax=Branchiostoma lanceolatum TaxID=7740 RepID=UPI003453FEB8
MASNNICEIRWYNNEQGKRVCALDYSSKHFERFESPSDIRPEDIGRINLEENELQVIPAEIFDMPNLEDLNLRHNYLTGLPKEISKLRRLKRLWVAMNYIKKLPDTICQMENLESLHLGSNELRKLPKKFGNLKLKELWINDNYFVRFPGQITKIKTLEKLDAHGNQIKTMPKAIRELSGVISLDMHKNKLISLPRAIVSLLKSKLKRFVYHANKIATHPRGFDQVISKMNDTPPNCNFCKKHKSKQKQTDGKSNKSATTTEAAKVKEDNVVDAKTTDEHAVASVAEQSQLRVSDVVHQAPENGQLVAARCAEHLHPPSVAHDVGAQATNDNNYYGPVNIFHGPVYINSIRDNDSQSVNDTSSPKEKSTMDTKDTLNELIQFTAATAIPSSYKKTARQLGLTEDAIDRIQEEYQGTEERCVKALTLWRRDKGKDATVEVLKKALIKAGRKDVVDDFDARNSGSQDVTSCDSGQAEEETCVMEAASCSHNIESDKRKHA